MSYLTVHWFSAQSVLFFFFLMLLLVFWLFVVVVLGVVNLVNNEFFEMFKSL